MVPIDLREDIFMTYRIILNYSPNLLEWNLHIHIPFISISYKRRQRTKEMESRFAALIAAVNAISPIIILLFFFRVHSMF